MKTVNFINKLLGIVLILGFNLNQANSQTSIEIDYPNTFAGIDNPLQVQIENTPCDSIYVKSIHGQVIKTAKNCGYKYRTKTVGIDLIQIYKIKTSDTILVEQRRIIVNKWPKQPAEFGKRGSGNISKAEFLTTQEIIARISGFDMSGKHKVKSFIITLIRSNKEIFKSENIGGRIENKNIAKLKIIQNNDVIEFTRILAFMPGERSPRMLNDIIMKISN